MASLTGQTIQSTYDGLLKTSDSDAITSSLKRITDGLGNFTPLYLSTTAVEVSTGLTANSFIKSGGTSSQFLKADGSVDSSTYTPTSRTLTINGETYDLSANRSWTIAAGVTSFNTRTGAITLTSGDVTGALGFTPYNATNPAGYISGITRTQVINALGTGGSPFEFLKSDGTVDTNSYVTFGRTITINGTTQDLSADRTFSVGTVTSVSGTGTVSGLTLTGSVTSSGSLTLGGTLTLTSGQVTSALGYTPVPNTRTLTINGTTFDLTTDRSWTVAGGISSLNGLTGATQTFATGTSGSDFNIASTGTTHTFNIPTASSSTRGLLSSADWVIFANRISGSLTTNFVPKANGATSLTNSLIFDNGTNVGINTTSPTERLHVVGNGRFSGVLNVNAQALASTGSLNIESIDPTIRFRVTGGTSNKRIYEWRAIAAGGVNDYFQLRLWNDAESSATQLFGIDSSANAFFNGNVGIGTSSPGQRLQISGGSSIVDLGHSYFTYTSDYGFGTPNSDGLQIFSGDSIRLGLRSSGSFSERMRITSGGNVGIGTTDPSGGGIISSRFTVNQSDGSTGITILNGTSRRFALNPIASGGFTMFDGGGGTWNAGITQVGGNVGIGTSSPSSRLHIRQSSSEIPLIIDSSASGNASYTQYRANGSSGWEHGMAGSGDSFKYFFSYGTFGSGTSLMTLQNNGNVGIGTSSPGSLLHVGGSSGAVSTPTAIEMDGTYRTGAAAFNALKFYLFKGASESYGIGLGDLADVQYWAGSSSTGAHRFFTSQTERMRITSGGNVGIGATNPTDGRLQVAGSTQLGNTIAQTFFGVAAYSQWVTSGGAFAMGLDGAAGATERMRISSSGNLGINTTNPVVRLQVEGQMSVNTNTGAITNNTTASFRAITGTSTDRVLEAYSISYSALFYLQNNGSYFFAGSNLSDARAKKDITYYSEPVLDKVMQLKPASFRYTQNDENIKGGFIAQEIKEIFPDLVTKTQDEEDLMGVDYYGVIALLTKAVQELKQEIEELKNR